MPRPQRPGGEGASDIDHANSRWRFDSSRRSRGGPATADGLTASVLGLTRHVRVLFDLIMPAGTLNAVARVVLRNVSWETYEGLLSARGDDPAPKLTYDGGNLEILSPTGLHEWVKRLLARFVDTFTFERGIEVRSAGSTTLRVQFKEKGLEPDESYYITNEPLLRFKDHIDLAPDLAIDVDISASSIDKLGIYASLGVSEVWSHDETGVVMHALRSSGKYERVAESVLLPGLTAAILNHFLGQRSQHTENSLVRAFRDRVRTVS